MKAPDLTAPIFLDRTGRRARRLRRTTFWVIALVLALLAVLWLSQMFVAVREVR